MSPRKLGGRPEEPQDLFQELLEEANIDEEAAPERPPVVGLEETLPPHAQLLPDGLEETAAGYAETEDFALEQAEPEKLAAEQAEPEETSPGYEEAELQEFLPGNPEPELSLGYEEFAEVPTGSYTLPEDGYDEEDVPAYSSPDDMADGRRAKKNREETYTGAVLRVPLREVSKERVVEQTEGRPAAGKETRRRNRVLAWVFCGFIFGMLILLCAVPKSYFSDEERRVLAAEPTFTAQTVFDGSFEEDAETYISDHFPFRTFWVGLNSYYNLASGRPLINGVYVGRDGYFMEEPTECDETKIAANMNSVRAFLAERNLPAAFLAVPSAGSVMRDMLPEVHLPYRDADILATARIHLDDAVEWIDVSGDLVAESAVEQVFYRTDHHWTTLGAYIGYLRWAQQQGVAAIPVDRFRISYYDGFRGTTYAKVLLWNVKPDMIQLWENGGSYTVEMSDGSEEPVVTDTFYDIPALTSYDPYMVFFGGNHGLMHIHNNDETAEGTLLVIKDSYANCLIPFIAPHYADMYVVDPRYYRDLRGLCDRTDFDSALFVYGVNSLVNDQDLGLIDM